jgi:hypothetical protein
VTDRSFVRGSQGIFPFSGLATDCSRSCASSERNGTATLPIPAAKPTAPMERELRGDSCPCGPPDRFTSAGRLPRSEGAVASSR